MITNCYSYDGNCPCLEYEKTCCIDMGSKIDTEKLCEEARIHCEKCTLEHKEVGEEE